MSHDDLEIMYEGYACLKLLLFTMSPVEFDKRPHAYVACHYLLKAPLHVT